MKHYFADLHIHIGRSNRDHVVKVTGARNLTFANIMQEASERKGIDLVGIIDAHSPVVQEEIEEELKKGNMEELTEGGIRFQNSVVLLGTEVEVKPSGFPAFHLLLYFPTLQRMREFSQWMSSRVTNLQLSTQRLYAAVREVQQVTKEMQGLLVPAHIFTPFKGIYSSVARLEDVLDPAKIDAVELGLSADTSMAARIPELTSYSFPFLSNSDAHSLPKIGREYNRLLLQEPNFEEVCLALRSESGRRILANHGLHPELGKYHTTFCLSCEKEFAADDGTRHCPHCESGNWVFGVRDRITLLEREQRQKGKEEVEEWRARAEAPYAPYYYHVPLEFFPKVGKQTLRRLLSEVGTEMFILHQAELDELAGHAGNALASRIGALRNQEVEFHAGGGGRYGKVIFPDFLQA